MELNEPAADFELTDTEGRAHRLSEHLGQIVILNFWSCECPHSERTDGALLELAAEWGDQVALIAIASNRSETAETIRSVSESRHLPTVLLDAEHAVADLYGAQTTPHVWLIDREGVLRYRGAVDDVTFWQRNASRSYLREAVEAVFAGRRPLLPETPAYGCAIVREALE